MELCAWRKKKHCYLQAGSPWTNSIKKIEALIHYVATVHPIIYWCRANTKWCTNFSCLLRSTYLSPHISNVFTSAYYLQYAGKCTKRLEIQVYKAHSHYSCCSILSKISEIMKKTGGLSPSPTHSRTLDMMWTLCQICALKTAKALLRRHNHCGQGHVM